MPRRGSIQPLLVHDDVLASPGEESLQGHLDLSSTLNKKPSWLGSLRGAGQKVALGAKAIVDTVRGDHAMQDKDAENFEHLSSEPRTSSESAESTKVLVSPSKHRDPLPKKATASLRQVLTSKKHRKHGSLYSFTSTTRGEDFVDGLIDPADFAVASNVESHGRSPSLARSIVGSLRGLGRIGTHKRHSIAITATVDQMSPAEMPLPSSPIAIPAQSIPALSLDFGPAGFNPEFKRSPEKFMADRNLTDPANTKRGPPIYRAYLPGKFESKTPPDSDMRTATPKDFFRPPSNEDRSPYTSPATPMPGTTFSLQIDGAESDKTASRQVFERNVELPESPVKKSGKAIRSMRSLDAMAEVCRVGHETDDSATAVEEIRHKPIVSWPTQAFVTRDHDEAATHSTTDEHTAQLPAQASTEYSSVLEPCSPSESTERLGARALSDIDQAGMRPSPSNLLGLPTTTRCPSEGRRDLSSATTTISVCPPDMLDLARVSHRSTRLASQTGSPVCGPRGSTTTELLNADPFTDESGASVDKTSSASTELEKAMSSSGYVTEDVSSLRFAEQTSSNVHVQEAAALQTARATFAIAVGCHPFDLDRLAELARTVEKESDEHDLPSTEAVDAVVNDHDSVLEYDEFKTQALFANGNDIALPDYDKAIPTGMSSSSIGGSPGGGPLIPSLYQYVSRNGSPGRQSTHATRTSNDVNDLFWHFSMSKWLGSAVDAEEETSSHRHMSTEMSIDSVSLPGQPSIPPCSPTSTTADRSPSMGSPLDFESRQAERNMRYNALHEASPGLGGEISYVDSSAQYLFRPADDPDDEDLKLADFSSAFAGSREGPARNRPAIGQSDGSAAETLETCAAAYDQLQQKLEAFQTTDEHVRYDAEGEFIFYADEVMQTQPETISIATEGGRYRQGFQAKSPTSSAISLVPSAKDLQTSPLALSGRVAASPTEMHENVVAASESENRGATSSTTPNSRKRYGNPGKRKALFPIDANVVANATL